jgi:hypothetical protein
LSSVFILKRPVVEEPVSAGAPSAHRAVSSAAGQYAVTLATSITVGSDDNRRSVARRIIHADPPERLAHGGTHAIGQLTEVLAAQAVVVEMFGLI